MDCILQIIKNFFQILILLQILEKIAVAKEFAAKAAVRAAESAAQFKNSAAIGNAQKSVLNQSDSDDFTESHKSWGN